MDVMCNILNYIEKNITELFKNSDNDIEELLKNKYKFIFRWNKIIYFRNEMLLTEHAINNNIICKPFTECYKLYGR